MVASKIRNSEGQSLKNSVEDCLPDVACPFATMFPTSWYLIRILENFK